MTVNFHVLCPTCGQPLGIQHDESVSEPQAEDRLVCPTHGDVGSYADFQSGIREAALNQGREAMLKEARDLIAKGRLR